jgi:eukaryotic-like serine/threonine-protein kinase
MSLYQGAKLGPYEIVEQVGAGGMGEVYRAKDTRLERIVAIKILPSHLSANAQLRQRFEREAKTISSISHPHICSLYDIGQQDGIDFLVMEFLEGETVADRLQKGALPFEQALRYGIEIADALEKAHKQGIVHRDLKPGNIMITKSGVKLLDFGLAKLQVSLLNPPFTEASALPTQSPDLTAEGTILGTIQYMAPEQLEAREVDARTDIHALGVVLYEMATGKHAFSGKSQASLIAAILSSEPPSISATQPLVPPAFENVVKTCMAKDPDDRWQTAHDVKLELKWILERSSQASIAAPAEVKRQNRWRFIAIFLTLALAISTAAALLQLLGKRPPQNSLGQIRFRLSAPPESPMDFPYVGDVFSVSPNGEHIVYARTTADAKSQLWLRSLKKTSWELLAGTESGISPFWSPDSREIAFFADGRLKKINLASGSVQSLCNVSSRGIGNAVSGSWGTSGTILFIDDEEGLYGVLSSGGPSKFIRKDVFWPHFLPDGRHFLCLFIEELGKSYQLSIGNLDSKELRKLMPIASSVAYADPGHLLYIRDDTLVAHPFDAKAMRFTGEPSPVAEQVGSNSQYAWSFFSVSQNGLLLYFPISLVRLVWLDRNGHEIGTVSQPNSYGSFSISPDGRKVAVGISDPQVPNEQDLWIFDLERGTSMRFTHAPGLEYKPIWSSDGNQILFTSELDQIKFLLKELNSKDEGRQVLPAAKDQRADDWSSDGEYAIYTALGVNKKLDLWVLPMSKGGKPFNFTQSPFFEYWGKFSPDGKWVAFVSDESGGGEVYVAPFPNTGQKIRVSTAGGDEPLWSKDGKEMFYTEGQYVVSVPVKLGSKIELGKPTRLFRFPQRKSSYDVTPDGRRFLIAVPAEAADVPLTVIVNWMEELRRD